MVTGRMGKLKRHEKLKNALQHEPFITDEELAAHFHVSIQTIRLDRMELKIPEQRERMKQMATQAYGSVKSLSQEEIFGELVDLELGKSGISILIAQKEMAFERNGIIRGHHIFAQANSLAVAIIDAEVVLTGEARLRYLKPVVIGDKIIARGKIMSSKKDKYRVEVITKVNGETVFRGEFVMVTKMRDEEGI